MRTHVTRKQAVIGLALTAVIGAGTATGVVLATGNDSSNQAAVVATQPAPQVREDAYVAPAPTRPADETFLKLVREDIPPSVMSDSQLIQIGRQAAEDYRNGTPVLTIVMGFTQYDGVLTSDQQGALFASAVMAYAPEQFPRLMDDLAPYM